LRTFVRVQGVRPAPVLYLSLSPLLSSQPAAGSCDPGCGFHPTIPVPVPAGTLPPPFSLSPCEGGQTVAGRFRRGASGGDGVIVRRKKIRADGGARNGRAEKMSNPL